MLKAADRWCWDTNPDLRARTSCVSRPIKEERRPRIKTSSDWDVSCIVYMKAMQKTDEWPRCEIKRGLLSQIPFDKCLMGFQPLPPAAVTQPSPSSPSVPSLGRSRWNDHSTTALIFSFLCYLSDIFTVCLERLPNCNSLDLAWNSLERWFRVTFPKNLTGQSTIAQGADEDNWIFFILSSFFLLALFKHDGNLWFEMCKRSSGVRHWPTSLLLKWHIQFFHFVHRI